MTAGMNELVRYRILRAKETLEDAKLLADKGSWNSSINRLYYAMYYALTALLLKEGYQSTTHNGVKTQFSEHFIKTGKFSLDTGKTYAQLFTWRQKGDYAD